MKLGIAILIYVIHSIMGSPCAHREWTKYKIKYKKSYKSVTEDQLRFKIFKENLNFIEKHNVPGKSFRVDINAFSDLTHEEMRKMKGHRPPANRRSKGVTFLPPHNVEIPKHVDWRTKGYVTPVKNQGICGSCYAFSATGSLEGQHFRKTGKLVSLSEQNIVDCSSGPDGNQGCGGGYVDNAYDYIIYQKGIDTEKSYPYDDTQNFPCRYKAKYRGAIVKNYVDLKEGNETLLMIAVATVGPVHVAIDASNWNFDYYKNGVYVDHKCKNGEYDLDHAVLVVGYGTYEGKDYWLVKNSWGTSWGMKGYIMMARNHNNMCGIATDAGYPLV